MPLYDAFFYDGGFTKNHSKISISAKFILIKLYEFKCGYYLKSDEIISGKINGKICYAIGNCIDSLLKLIIDDELIENEKEYSEKKDIHPPFLITYIITDEEYVGEYEYYKINDGKTLYTYDAFTEVKKNIWASFEEQELPLLMPMVSIFAKDVSIFNMQVLEKYCIGRNNEWKYIFDYVIRVGDVEIYQQCPIDLKIGELKSKEDVKAVKYKVAKLIIKAYQEKDIPKKFITAWTALEVYINNRFSDFQINMFPCDEFKNYKYAKIEKYFNKGDYKIQTFIQKVIYLCLVVFKCDDLEIINRISENKKYRDRYFHGEVLTSNEMKNASRVILMDLMKIIFLDN